MKKRKFQSHDRTLLFSSFLTFQFQGSLSSNYLFPQGTYIKSEMSGIGRAGESVAAEADVAETFHQGFQHSNLGGADSNTSDEKLSDGKKAHAVEEDYDDLGDVPEGCTIPTEEVSCEKEKAGILTLFPRLSRIAHLLAFEFFTVSPKSFPQQFPSKGEEHSPQSISASTLRCLLDRHRRAC